MTVLALSILAYVACGTVAVIAADTGRKRLQTITKPLTTILLFFIIGWPSDRFATIVYAGVLLSLIGDVALLSDSNQAFMIGLASFMLGYGTYVGAFISEGHLGPSLLLFIAVMSLATSLLLRRIWAGAAGLHAPVVAYAATISTMVVSAWSTNGGRLSGTHALLASVGATLLYVSDSSLAVDKFGRRIPHVPVMTMGVYWLGQLGVALAAR